MRLLTERPLSRRDFLKACGTLAALMGVGQSAVPRIARALEDAAARPPVVWLDFQECLGCTESMTKSRYPDFLNVVLDMISLEYSEALMAGAGRQAEKNYADTVVGQPGKYVLVVEGSVATKIPNAMTVGGRTSVDIAKEALTAAVLVVAVGNCASFGNVQAAYPNPTGAMGMLAFMEQEGIDTGKLIQLPTCPVNPVHITTTISYFLTYGKVPPMDQWHRPLVHFGRKIHDECPRRAHFDEGRFVEVLGSAEEDERLCLYKVGCRGPHTYADCATVLWNNRANWCIGSGQCIGCAEKDFWDELVDFYRPMPGVAVPGFGGIRADADTIGIGLAAATGVAIAAHLAVSAAKGRLGRNEDQVVIEEKEE
ncbi:MAG: hydrogenase small subunit [Thermoleophilia bacterium]|nr:hydrogenase small subunit [Thermoleophilia bacterium]